MSSAICAVAESPSRLLLASCASTAARRCASVIARAAASCACFSSVIAQRGKRAVLLRQFGQIGQLRGHGVLVDLHGLVQLGDLLLHVGELRLGIGQLPVGIGEAASRLSRFPAARHRCGWRKRSTSFCNCVDARGARLRLQIGIGQLLRQLVALVAQGITIGAARCGLILQRGKLLRQRVARGAVAAQVRD